MYMSVPVLKTGSSKAEAAFGFVFFADCWLMAPGVLLASGFADGA